MILRSTLANLIPLAKRPEPVWHITCVHRLRMNLSRKANRLMRKLVMLGARTNPARLLRILQKPFVFSFFGLLLLGCGFAGSPPTNEVVVLINPPLANVALGQTQQFQASVTGSTNTAVVWTVNGLTGGNATTGTISSSGLFIAPQSLPNPASVTVTAASQAAPQSSASAVVTLTDGLQVSVSPGTASVAAGAAQVFSATVSNAGSLSTAVTWSVNGISGGNSTVGLIVSNGANTAVYTAPMAVPSPPVVTIAAISTADTARSGTAAVTITCSATNFISPSSANVSLGRAQTFTASLCAALGAPISWDVNGVAGGSAVVGTIVVTGPTTATFAAPQNVPSPNSLQIHATSGPASATATVMIVSNIAVAISPASASLSLNQRQTFTPTVTNTTNTALSWAVNGVANGSAALGQLCQQATNPCQPPPIPFSGNVDYLAPVAVPAQNPITLTATSAADSSRSASATITIAGATGNVSLTISPFYAFLPPSTGSPSTQNFFTSVAGSTNSAVTWSVQSAVSGQGCTGTACGSIVSTGNGTALYTAPVGAPSPNAVSVTAISVADSTKSATATVSITSGPVIEVMLPSSVFSGAVESFPLSVQGANFVPGAGVSASTLLINGVARGTTCAASTGCVTALNLADVQAAGTLTIQIQNPSPSNALSNPVPFVIVPLDTSVAVIALTPSAPAVTQLQLIVPEPTTAASSAPINVDSIGSLSSGNCEIAGSPVTVTRPASGTTVQSLCIHGNNLDPTFTYSFSGAGGVPNGNDLPVTASAIPGLFPNLIELDLQIASTTLPGVRSLFITTLNNDRAVATGMLEVK